MDMTAAGIGPTEIVLFVLKYKEKSGMKRIEINTTQ